MDVSAPDPSIPKRVFWIPNVSARIWIRATKLPIHIRVCASDLRTNLCGLDPTFDFSDFQDAKKIKFFFLIVLLTVGTVASIIIRNIFTPYKFSTKAKGRLTQNRRRTIEIEYR
jgi:hypothetical protein